MNALYRFGRFELNPTTRQLLADGEALPMGVRAFDVLHALIERRERLVTKNELLDLAWPGLFVEENNLQVQVSTLRKLLGPQAIATIPGRGYRFTAALGDSQAQAQAQAQSAPAPLAPAAAEATAAATSGLEFKTNLPEALRPLIGRDDDVAALGTLIAQHRLISIVAAGGMGKTRLALHLLHERRLAYEHGVCWVDLADLSDPQLVVSTVASALGIKSGSGDPLEGLTTALRGMRLMVALDNAERLVDEVARVVQKLIGGAPQLRLLVTSQVPLKCAGERVYRLASLSLPEVPVTVDEARTYGAIALFAERARAADRHFELTPNNVATVIEICRHLDGMALAIELAAVRVPLLGVTNLAGTLSERLRLFTGGSRTAPQRHKTLRAAIEWSHALLNPAEQTVFRRLGVFAGGFALEMAQQVVADEANEAALDEWAVLDLLGALVDRSLVMVDAGDPPRYRMLESPRAFALEKLTAAGEMAAWQRRHAHAVLARFTAVNADCWGGRIGVDDAIALLEKDLDNAREAMAWAIAHDAHAAVASATAMELVLTYARRAELLRMWEATAALVTDALPDAVRADWASGCARFWVIEKPALTKWARMAIELYRRLGDPMGQYQGLSALCFSETSLATGSGHQVLNEMMALEDPGWPPLVRYRGAMAEFFLCISSGDFARAKTAIQRQLALAQQAGSSDFILQTQANLADIALAAGDVDDAVRIGIEVERRASIGNRYGFHLAEARINLTGALLAQGSLGQARAMAAAAWPLAKEFLLMYGLVDNLTLLAALEGRAQDAAKLCGCGDAIYAANGVVRQINEARMAARAEQLAREKIGEAGFERLKAEGAALGENDIVKLAFGLKDA